MKMQLSKTALVIALAAPTLIAAQTQPPAPNPATTRQETVMQGFLDQRSATDLFASDLMGHDVHARRGAGDMPMSDPVSAPVSDPVSGDAAMPRPQAGRALAPMRRSDLETMDTIGQITEIVISDTGEVRAFVIGVGGFLGMGEHDVAVTMDQISFAADADDPSETYIMVNTDAQMMRDYPPYDRTGRAMPGRAGFLAPQLQRDGYTRVEITEVSSEVLIGKSVYDLTDADIGTVTDMIINDAGEITDVIIDFGGFLGIGSSQASLRFDELTILSTSGTEDLRVYVDATREQIEALPQYQAAN